MGTFQKIERSKKKHLTDLTVLCVCVCVLLYGITSGRATAAFKIVKNNNNNNKNTS